MLCKDAIPFYSDLVHFRPVVLRDLPGGGTSASPRRCDLIPRSPCYVIQPCEPLPPGEPHGLQVPRPDDFEGLLKHGLLIG